MKKKYLIICTLLGWGVCTYAQTVLQSTDLMYDITLSTAFVGYSEPGPGGENINWDFSDAITEDATDFSFGAPLESDLIDFPEANVSYFRAGASRFFKHTQDQTELLGQYNEQSSIVYSDPVLYHEFPIAYGSSFTDDFVGLQTNTVGEMVNTEGTFIYDVDAYGTLVLPSGTYENVLRIKREYQRTITGMDFMVGTTEIDYEWYHPDYPMAILAMNRLTITATGDLVAETGVMLELENVGIEENAGNLATLYPNPASDVFYIDLAQHTGVPVNLAVYDMLGRTVLRLENEILEGEQLQIDAGKWEKGSYIIHLQQGDKSWHNKLSLL